MKKVAIIGAGISGLFFANLLRHDSNYEIKIYEKNNSINLEKGYGIQLSVNSIRFLNKIDFQNLIFRKVLIFMKIFENVFCYFRYSLNWYFEFFFTNLPISRNKCLSRFLYKHKNGIFRKPSHRILMLCKDKMYIILIEKLLLLRIFLQNKSFSNKIQKTILFKKKVFPKTTLNNGPIVKSS